MLVKWRLYYTHLKEEETETQVTLFISARQLVNSRYRAYRGVIKTTANTDLSLKKKR